jgi:O-acetyl-ADP-ribose deacetylase (regulator of RNase III)
MTTKQINWTNKSVKTFADGDNPVLKMESVARKHVLKALDEGWTGPPFDPIQLAKHLDLNLVPNSAIQDARTVPDQEGRLTIEFNPNRPRGRVRFSIAHEIAHTFFDDCADEIRHRDSTAKTSRDNWQLEMLCNLGAAELIMPIGSDPHFERGSLSMNMVMDLRKKFDVSTEALLIRHVKLTNRPLAIFCASRIEGGNKDGQYRIDYSIPSRSWPFDSVQGHVLESPNVVNQCTAIGFIASGTEKIIPNKRAMEIECVGLPPYPGSIYPRVAGFIKTDADRKPSINEIKFHVGDATEPGGTGKRIIAHIINDATPNWGGGGFAVALKRRYKHVQQEFKSWASSFPDHFQLGNGCMIRINDELKCYNMVAQRGYRYTGSPLIRYSALGACLEDLAKLASADNASIHMPRIGVGNARGNWDLVEELISETLLSKGIPVHVYDFEG